MSRFFLGIFAILLLFSCSPHLMVREIDAKNFAVNAQTGAIDSAIEKFIKPYHDSIEHDMSKLVAVSATPLMKGKPESKLTNLVADLVLDFGVRYCKKQNQDIYPVASYVNYGGLRASLPQGNITVGNIFEVMPFENEVVLLKVTGKAIREMADRIAGRGGEGVAGLKIGIKNDQAKTLLIDGQVADDAATYWIVTNDYIANGGDQMTMLSNPVERINTGERIRNVIISGLREKYWKEGDLNIQEDRRIYYEQ
jgi:2',3'-cyclic-nucleotide 2'-phosphodiesterase (5'-nucleotidase family)